VSGAELTCIVVCPVALRGVSTSHSAPPATSKAAAITGKVARATRLCVDATGHIAALESAGAATGASVDAAPFREAEDGVRLTEFACV
jgi:hypothetical protein